MRRSGFSLIEMLVTLGVLSILVSVTILALSPGRHLQQAQDSKILTEINQLEARVRDWQITGGVLSGITNSWQPICRYKEPCAGVSFDGLQDDDYVELIPWLDSSQSPYTGFAARSADGIVEVTAMLFPTDVSGLVVWLDASDLSTIFENTAGTDLAEPNDGVARWNDKSGAGNNVSQTTGARQPNTGVDTLAGHNVISYTRSTADCLYTTAFDGFSTGNQNHTVFFVGKDLPVNPSNANGWAWGRATTPPSATNRSSAWIPFGPAASNQVWYFFSNDLTDSDEVADETGVLAFRYNSSYGRQIWRNGVLVAERTSGNTLSFDEPQHFSIGCFNRRNTSSAYSFSGDIAEFVAYNRALTDDEMKKIEEYLSEKWGI
jgi:prepilin-type N-terminal cleavage/methylation domain-containing protein